MITVLTSHISWNRSKTMVGSARLNKRLMATKVLLGLGALCMGGLSTRADAHAFGQRVGFYEDNESLDRRRLAVEGRWDGAVKPQVIEAQYSLALSWTRDQDQLKRFPDEELRRFNENPNERTNDQWGVMATQSWAKLTQTRQVFQGAEDGRTSSNTVGAGVSRWILGESVRLSFDISRTESQRPEIKILDFDSREVGDPPEGLSRGVVLGIRHLATPSTLVDYSLSQTARRGRPDAQAYSVRLRQYLARPQPRGSEQIEVPGGTGLGSADPFASPSELSSGRVMSLATMKMSVELALTRAVNKGTVGVDTTYGEVDGVTWETYANMEFPGVLMARLGYRYYKDEEVTRVLREEKLFGSDLITAGISYFFDPAQGGDPASFSGNLVVSRYQTNQGLLGRSIELGLSALL